jgi:hypothetical protein
VHDHLIYFRANRVERVWSLIDTDGIQRSTLSTGRDLNCANAASATRLGGSAGAPPAAAGTTRSSVDRLLKK